MLFNQLFAFYLQERSLLNEDEVKVLVARADEQVTPIYLDLVKSKKMSESIIYQALAAMLGFKYKTFQLTEINFRLVDTFPREKLIEYRVVPYESTEDTIVFALSNPFRIEELKELASNLGKKADFFLITNSQCDELIHYIDNKIQQNTVLTEFVDSSKKPVEDDEDLQIAIDAPVIKLCDSILKDAISRGASDIHIEPFPDEIILRYRIDGKLTIIDKIKPYLYQSILARFKIMAEMNIAERRIPQDGKINLEINGTKFDFRVSTIPTINGEKAVIRIYNITLSTGNLSTLGLNKKQEQLILNMITRPHGIILLTGPTGSGKSTSLYTFLRYLNKEDTNIITVEDPVENQISGINQVQVNAKANLTFAAALRSILRQDPNIIMIGEIRDEETAQIATRAAITGHLVLSTIHTNDATGTVARLVNMGIAPYLVADALLGAISQRLVRKLCPECKKEHVTTASEMEILHINRPARIYVPCGCPACNQTGYQGRVAVFEILVCDQKVKDAILKGQYTSDVLNKIVMNSMETLLENARYRVLTGMTSVSEFEDLSDIVKHS